MTRKDYILIAAALELAKPIMSENSDWHKGWKLSVVRVCDALASDNPRFDRARFLAACGLRADSTPRADHWKNAERQHDEEQARLAAPRA